MKPYSRLSTLLLALVAVLQLLLFAMGWKVSIDGVSVPLWCSAVLTVAIGGLALMLHRESKRLR
jgi:hypothetical protein